METTAHKPCCGQELRGQGTRVANGQEAPANPGMLLGMGLLALLGIIVAKRVGEK